jgi:hypothetical protein
LSTTTKTAPRTSTPSPYLCLPLLRSAARPPDRSFIVAQARKARRATGSADGTTDVAGDDQDAAHPLVLPSLLPSSVPKCCPAHPLIGCRRSSCRHVKRHRPRTDSAHGTNEENAAAYALPTPLELIRWPYSDAPVSRCSFSQPADTPPTRSLALLDRSLTCGKRRNPFRTFPSGPSSLAPSCDNQSEGATVPVEFEIEVRRLSPRRVVQSEISI